ncbi:MAG: UbiD family decarboxylase domain-containing protein [Halobacteriota archaeon]
MEFRATVDALEAAGDLLTVEARVADPTVPFAIAAEAARANGPAILLADVPGTGRLACGVRGGPDRMARRERYPWSRLARGLGVPADTTYKAVLDVLSNPPAGRPSLSRESAMADSIDPDLTALCLPSIETTDRQLVSTGLLAVQVDGHQHWVPVRGSIRGRTELRLHVPSRLDATIEDAPVTVVLGVPTAALIAAHLMGADAHPWRTWSAPHIAAALDEVPVTAAAGGVVPASAEVSIDGTLSPAAEPADTPIASWEVVGESVPVTVEVDQIATRPEPIVPLTPLGQPLSDDTHLTSLLEGVRLHARVNDYWGVSPVSWIGLPVEAELGICLVASEILYAGFEWQLANTLFSFARSFDKVVVLDTDTAFEDLAGALDDIWVKAHPSHDWVFSEPVAPAASAPAYREDGQVGPRLYVNAAWDPRWDEEYIAPPVTLEEMYPADIRRAVRDGWTELGFESEPEATRD